jgi:hypothetical protein
MAEAGVTLAEVAISVAATGGDMAVGMEAVMEAIAEATAGEGATVIVEAMAAGAGAA